MAAREAAEDSMAAAEDSKAAVEDSKAVAEDSKVAAEDSKGAAEDGKGAREAVVALAAAEDLMAAAEVSDNVFSMLINGKVGTVAGNFFSPFFMIEAKITIKKCSNRESTVFNFNIGTYALSKKPPYS